MSIFSQPLIQNPPRNIKRKDDYSSDDSDSDHNDNDNAGDDGDGDGD